MDYKITTLLEQLTGQEIPFLEKIAGLNLSVSGDANALGYSQLNELLLLAGLDRIHESFFSYLLSGELEYMPGAAFTSLEQLHEGIQRFRKIALTFYGNVKFAFKTISADRDALEATLSSLEPIPEKYFTERHSPVLPLVSIAPEDAYLTGYIVEKTLLERIKNPSDLEAAELMKRREMIVQDSLRNQEAYYASDHMDVYVATSMREKHEFVSIGVLSKAIFEHSKLKPLKLRWFDPTQALCADRIDKGLAEALMLKRASCTIYLAQATDTLGKDSELASTLAQGKPVIAYVPEVTEEYFAMHLKTIEACEPEQTEIERLFHQLFVFEPEAAWKDPEFRPWVGTPDTAPIDEIRKRLFHQIRTLYDRRAATLRDAHPLGIQVNLQTGVANGVLVARTPDECAELVYGIVTRTLNFDLEETEKHTLLREAKTQSIFRVMTKDAMLTNAFWNFYLR